jgi:invasin B
VSLARFASNLQIAQAVTEFGGVAAQGGLQLASGVHQSRAAEHLADVRVRMAISEEISTYLSRIVEEYGEKILNLTQQIKQVFTDEQDSHNARLKMSRYI